ncbi:hypothetical protein [Paenibacillus sedimenti]|uniref:Uncharacterized protein n=1 Tax=Paenibacillus sedimenti TaxID=2770274 RepID=A0A926KNK0_9BACL|nr:hypothetical protein [Paenibacillus sedimenti]MBD0380602.1 hypothetical protein [Paenibacillus sedimenti]
MLLQQPMLQTIETLERHLMHVQESRWLIGGSCGLLLHNVEIQRIPRDLDLYVDQCDVASLHEALQTYSMDTPAHSETPIYSSILSHYDILGNAVEVVGDFRVAAQHSLYQVEAVYLWERHSRIVHVTDSCSVKIMPLAHELLFNLLRDRPDRYEPIARVIRKQPAQHMPALQDLLARNSWGHDFRKKLELLFD